jgi:hypothetical protein
MMQKTENSEPMVGYIIIKTFQISSEAINRQLHIRHVCADNDPNVPHQALPSETSSNHTECNANPYKRNKMPLIKVVFLECFRIRKVESLEARMPLAQGRESS